MYYILYMIFYILQWINITCSISDKHLFKSYQITFLFSQSSNGVLTQKKEKKKTLDSKYKNPPIYSVIASEETILLLLDLITPHLLHFPSYRKDSAFAETVMSSWTLSFLFMFREDDHFEHPPPLCAV